MSIRIAVTGSSRLVGAALSRGATTNLEFTKALGRALHRPTILPLPTLAVRAAFGQMGQEMLLEGRRVSPAKLTHAGFVFGQPDIEAALATALAVHR